jgi:hypothetical protein
MSEPKRYRLDPESYLAEHPQGDFVDYQDYALLKAKVERLTKAGDEMAFMINESFDFPPNTPQPYIDAYLLLGIKKWVSAKESKPGA